MAEGKSWPQVVLWPPHCTNIFIPWHRKQINKYNHKILKDRAVGCTPLIPTPRPAWSINIVPRQPGLLHRETVSINEWKKKTLVGRSGKISQPTNQPTNQASRQASKTLKSVLFYDDAGRSNDDSFLGIHLLGDLQTYSCQCFILR